MQVLVRHLYDHYRNLYDTDTKIQNNRRELKLRMYVKETVPIMIFSFQRKYLLNWIFLMF